MKLCLLFVILGVAIIFCRALPRGAPSSACVSLTPNHDGVPPQVDRPSYTVSAVGSGNGVTVTISSNTNEEFQGFILQARSSKDRTKFINGEFTPSEVSKATNCFSGKKNTLTHVSADNKKKVVTVWTPRGTVNEDVVFRATVAKNFSHFWTEIDSSPVKISSSGTTDATETSKEEPMYESCFVSKGCFGLPSGCIQKTDCEVLLAYSKSSDGILFEVRGYLDTSKYMAVGLSFDGAMGEDQVTECIRNGPDVVARNSWNEGRSNTKTTELERNAYSSSFSDGLSTCSWKLPYSFDFNEYNYDLANNKYYILLAKGDVNNGRIRYHEERLASSEAINFTAFEAIEAKGVTDSVKIHGVSDDGTTSHNPTTVSSENGKATPTSASKEGKDKTDSNGGSLLSFSILLVIFEVLCAAKGIFIRLV